MDTALAKAPARKNRSQDAGLEGPGATFTPKSKQETAAEFARRGPGPLWQFKFYDHILRRSDSADRVAWYIWANPVRKGLRREPKDYLFGGSFTHIGTRMLRGAPSAEWTPPWQRRPPEKAETRMPG